MQFYLVGGAVRDTLLEYPFHDKDWVVVGASPQEMLDKGFQQVGSDFPVFLHPKTKEEYALARTERKSGSGYLGFDCYAAPDVTLEEDLTRRDLTINAMALSEEDELIDPYGGKHDLENKILRHVSDAFVEDPLRVLRVARFAARYHHLGFCVASETIELMREISESGELQSLSAERIWKETSRALLGVDARVYFEVLRECGALAEIMPELDLVWGVPNPEQWHPEICTGEHTMLALQQASKLSDDIGVRYAALVHDLGKAVTPEHILPHHPEHDKNGILACETLSKRLKVPKEIAQQALLICGNHLLPHRLSKYTSAQVLDCFNSLDVWRKPERMRAFLLVCTADLRGRLGKEDIAIPEVELIESLYQVAASINVKQIVDAGFKGAEIRQELQRQQIAAIEKHRS